MTQNIRYIACFLLVLILASGCRTQHELIETGELREADITADQFAEMLPDYTGSLETVSGSGRGFISQPGNSDRVSIDFHSNREATLLTFRNRIGIEGGQLLVKNDSVLVYNKIDKIAEQVSLKDADLTEVGSLATINLVDLFHYPLDRSTVDQVFQDDSYYVASTTEGSRITADRESGLILDLQVATDSDAPYSRISYESYEQLNDFYLPRKITIFSADGKTRVTLLVRQLQVNRQLPPLEISIPDEIPILVL